ANGVDSYVGLYKKPSEQIHNASGLITNVNRVIYGHTHDVRHELIGAIEHLNSGTWSPGFTDVECTQSVGYKTFIWITPDEKSRSAKVLKMTAQGVQDYYNEG
ncbi:MAG: hypothetical protein MJK18_02900, partial [Bdellovibrionales bacterium]|nr:hypothetical protein [Bdellovibrionales bacterium]